MKQLPWIAQRWEEHRSIIVGISALVLLMLVLPFVANSAILGIAVYAMIFALPAIGLNLLMGLAGQVSLGHAAFFAVGGYVHAIMLTKVGLPAWLAAALAIVASMLIALATALPLLRLRGHFLALATLGLGFVVMILVRELEVTGRTTGIYGYGRPEVFGIVISNNALFLWFVTPFVVIGLLMAVQLARSRAGRALSAVNDSEVGAESLGVNTYGLRVKIFVISGGFAAAGGVLYAYYVQIVSPEMSSFHFTIQFLLMVIIGGMASVWGAVVGAFAVGVISEGLRLFIPVLIPGVSGEVQLLGYGIILILVLVLFPGGLHQIFAALWARIFRKNQTDTLASGAEMAVAISDSQSVVAAPAPTGEVLLSVSELTKRYGGVVALDKVSFEVHAGTIVGLIGPNGAGKTTCFNLIAGADAPSSGSVAFRGQHIEGRKPHIGAKLGLTRTFQNLQIFTSVDVLGNVYMGRYLRGRAGITRGMLGLQGREQSELRGDALELLRSLNLDGDAQSSAGDLSFGRQRMIEICRAIAAEPSLLLLDEPMAGLSGSERTVLAELLQLLRSRGMTILIVEHDVAQVMALADRVIVLDDGSLIADGAPEEVRNDAGVIAAYLGTEEHSVPEIDPHLVRVEVSDAPDLGTSLRSEAD